MDTKTRRDLTLWRYAILGPLVSARLEPGELRHRLEDAASETYEHPSKRRVKLSARTLETWYYRYKADGLAGLEPKPRSDAGRPRQIDDELRELLIQAKREKPRRSIRWLIKILVRAKRVRPGELSPSTVHRLLRHAGVSTRRPPREPSRERRSFLVERGGDLWMGDVMHGPRALVDGRPRKTYLINILDAATRCLVASEFRLSEDAANHEDVLKSALRIYGRPRTYYVDRGAAYMADTLRYACATLGIHLLHTKPRDCEAKGAIERFHETWRAEVGDELPDSPLALEELSSKHWAWLSREYHAREHSTTERRPLGHLLSEAEAGHLRPLERGVDLDAAFLHRLSRKVRKDGTVSLHGLRFEVLAEYVGETVELRFDPCASSLVPQVWRHDAFVCIATPLDLHRNATRRRRRLVVPTVDDVAATGLDPLGDLEREHYGRVTRGDR